MSTSQEERVRVAVRVRPFSQREESRGCKRIVDMDGALTTTLTNPQDPSDRKTFSFDHSFWSFDGFKLDAKGRAVADPHHPRGNQFCDQERVFDDLGRAMLADAFEGYNTTLFSYGQTGSGKSYNIMGYEPNQGIVPLFCHKLFQAIGERAGPDEKFEIQVTLSMLEIYNEAVYDLLNPTKNGRGLKVREHPKRGFYAEGLKNFVVTNYGDIERLIGQGTVNRTVAITNMNATSSRAHTIVVLTLIQKRFNQGDEVTTTSIVNIVDLAGSERVSKVGNTSGERFREGVAINQSLQCLGHCIHALAESSVANGSVNNKGGSISSSGNNKNQRIPYRDSTLTKLLMNALGGNSKTVMIASISPADYNYEETLSTLRYADRAKQIRTRATVNEDPTEQLVRDIKLENQRLKSLLARGTIDPQWLKTAANGKSNNAQVMKKLKKKWEDELRAQIAENDREMKEIRSSGQEHVQQKIQLAIPSRVDENSRSGPHLQNVNMDKMLSGQLLHFLPEGCTQIGKSTGASTIEMIGPGILEEHAEVKVSDNKVTLRLLNDNARVLINGAPVHTETILQPNDRLVFGSTQLWLFRFPALESEPADHSITDTFDYDFFLNEMAAQSGLEILSTSTIGNANSSLQDELVNLLPCIEEANGISAELDKRVKFEIVLIAPQILGNPEDRTLPSQAHVKMKNLENGIEYLWTMEKFLNRLDLMKEFYRRSQLQNYGEEEDAEDLRISESTQPMQTRRSQIDIQKNDPFAEPPDLVVVIGAARIFLQPLAYLVEIKDELTLNDLRGSPIGSLDVAIIPSEDPNGHVLPESALIESPQQLVGRDVYFQFQILRCRIEKSSKFKDIHCKYRFYADKDYSFTQPQSGFGHLVEFNYNRTMHFEPVSKELVDHLQHGSVVVQVLGRYIIPDPRSSGSLAGTRQLLRADRRVFSRTAELMADLHASNSAALGESQKQELMAELLLVRQTHVRLQQRLDFIRQLVDRCLLVGQETIPTAFIDAMLNVSSQEQAKRIIQQLQVEDGGEWIEWSPDERDAERKSSMCTIS